MELAQKIIDFRAINNLTQAELAEKIGVSRGMIVEIESGKRKVKRVTQRKIEIYLEQNR